ncbi:MAG: hypothetical protein NZ920_05155 [Aigarchaeota archaeon]|nr:hypothetical protein [Aigarchaeota archaeon]MDW8093322.1 hypothetical protein [Nitrososphaerota archaeon]
MRRGLSVLLVISSILAGFLLGSYTALHRRADWTGDTIVFSFYYKMRQVVNNVEYVISFNLFVRDRAGTERQIPTQII